MDEEISIEVKRTIIERRLTIWHNTAYEATIDFRVAQRVGDTDLMAAAKANIAKAEQMIAGYGLELEALQNGKVKEAGV